MSVFQRLSLLTSITILFLSTTQCIPTRRPSPSCFRSLSLSSDASVAKTDVIGGYLVFQYHMDQGSTYQSFGRIPSVFYVEKNEKDASKFLLSATIPRQQFNIYNIKRAFALVFLPDGSRSIIPLQNDEMRMVDNLDAKLKTYSFDVNSSSEVVRDKAAEGEGDRQELLRTLGRDFFRSKTLSREAAQKLLTSADSEKARSISKDAKLQMLTFSPSFVPEDIAFAFNQSSSISVELTAITSNNIQQSLQNIADISQKHDNAPILDKTQMEKVARLHWLLKRLDHLEDNVRSLNFYKVLAECKNNNASAICRQRLKMSDLQSEFFGFIDDECKSVSFEAFKASLKVNNDRSIVSCGSERTLLYSVSTPFSGKDASNIQDLENALRSELVTLYDKIVEIRTGLATTVVSNPDLLQLRTVMARSNTLDYSINDDDSFFGGVGLLQTAAPQNIDLKLAKVETKSGLNLDVQIMPRGRDITKCATSGAVITLGALPIDVASGGCMRLFETAQTEEPGQITENPAQPIVNPETINPSPVVDTQPESPAPPTNATPVVQEAKPADEKPAPVATAVDDLGSGSEREATPPAEQKHNAEQRNESGC